MARRIIYLPLLAFLYPVITISQNIAIPDLLLPDSRPAAVAVTGDLDIEEGAQASVILSYDRRALEILTYEADSSMAFYSGFKISEVASGSNIQSVRVSTESYGPGRDTLFLLRIRALAGSDISPPTIAVTEAFKADSMLSVDFTGGDIRFFDEQLKTLEIDLSPAFPNPFTEKVVLKFSISDSSRCNAKLFDIKGKLLFSFPVPTSADSDLFGYQLYHQSEQLQWEPGTNLGPGLYTLELFPRYYLLPSGQYYFYLSFNGIQERQVLVHRK